MRGLAHFNSIGLAHFKIKYCGLWGSLELNPMNSSGVHVLNEILSRKRKAPPHVALCLESDHGATLEWLESNLGFECFIELLKQLRAAKIDRLDGRALFSAIEGGLR